MRHGPRFPSFGLGPLGCAAALASLTACGGSSPATGSELFEAGVLPGDAASGTDAGLLTGSDGSLPLPGSDGGADAGLEALRIDTCGADNPAGLSQAQLEALQRGGPASGMGFLYPFEGTVFPRGLKAPLLMWEGSQGVAVRVHMRSSSFDYTGCLRADASGRIQLPQQVWEAAEQRSLGKSDPFAIELSELSASGVARGPIRESIIIAPGSLKGTVYYNSYSSQLAVRAGAPGGVILRIRPGADAEVFAGQRGCVGCHAVSANGTRMVASGDATEGVYTLTPNGPVNPPSTRGGADFVGLSPDGSVYLSYNTLVETDTGTLIEGAMIPPGAQHGSFSPDGRWITFIEPTQADPTTGIGEYEIVRMRYDTTGRRASERQPVVRRSNYSDWPSLLPDNGAVLFADQVSNQLMLADVASGSVTPLARAMAPSGDGTMPRADGSVSGAFYPTVVPVAAGGYFWIFFDSTSRYGNVDTSSRALNDPTAQPPDLGTLGGIFGGLFGGGGAIGGGIPLPTPGSDLPSRQLWGAAIEISADGHYTVDPSSPPFYLPGQELGTNNHRAFAALEPCAKLGTSCNSGVDCCDGFCRDGMCTTPPASCSRTEEACKSATDCCDAGELCISGFCSVLPVVLQ